MLPLIKKLGLPVVVTFYGVDGSSMIADPKWIHKFQEAFKYIDYVIVLSETVKTRVAELNFDPKKILVWNIPIRLDQYVFRLKARDNQIKFITAARFVEKKGYPFLIKAFKKVNEKYPNTTLTIIGYGAGQVAIDNAIAQHELQHAITVINTNLRTDFHSFYYQRLCEHDIFVLPSTTSKNGDDEGGPALTLVSAQAAGLPVICTPFVGSEITVFDHETGILCKQDDADSIAEKMQYLMENPELCTKIGKQASDLVHKLFSEKNQMDLLLNVYQNMQWQS